MYPALDFSGHTELTIEGEDLFVTDPIYIADVYKPCDDPIARYLRREGVFVSDFGGDASCVVLWKDPYLVLPVSANFSFTDLNERLSQDDAPSILADEVGCDSASFVFIAMRPTMPNAVCARVRSVQSRGNGAMLSLPDGTYRFFLEQLTPPADHARWPALYRNIVAEHLAARSKS